MFEFRFCEPYLSSKSKPQLKLGPKQRKVLDSFTSLIYKNKRILEILKCICENKPSYSDVVFLEKDRYGIPVQHLLCLNCGLIRISPFYKDSFLVKFYQEYYRGIYLDDSRSADRQFNSEYLKGGNIWKILKKKKVNLGNSIFEIGPGYGGILAFFKDQGCAVSGIELDEKSANYGNAHGIEIEIGSFLECSLQKKYDLVILNHTLEHLKYPSEYLLKVRSLLDPNGILYIEVPGILTLHRGIAERFFQNVHCYTYSRKILEKLLMNNGFDIIYSNEFIQCIAKPANLEQTAVRYQDLEHSRRIRRYLHKTILLYNLNLNIHKLYRVIVYQTWLLLKRGIKYIIYAGKEK